MHKPVYAKLMAPDLLEIVHSEPVLSYVLEFSNEVASWEIQCNWFRFLNAIIFQTLSTDPKPNGFSSPRTADGFAQIIDDRKSSVGRGHQTRGEIQTYQGL